MEKRETPAPPTINEKKESGGINYERYYGTQRPVLPPNSPPQIKPIKPVVPPGVKLEQFVIGPDTRIEGKLVRTDNAPRGNAKLLFVAASKQGPQQTVSTNSAGRFDVVLASGAWYVYTTDPAGKAVFHSRIEVNPNRATVITLVSK
jgi:hypothetical protein